MNADKRRKLEAAGYAVGTADEFLGAPPTPMEFLDEKALCAWLAISPSTAQLWRSSGRGPAYFKLGRVVRYNRADVEAWAQAQRVATA